MADELNARALEKRSTLPSQNAFSIAELVRMPPFFGWADCSSGISHFKMLLGGVDDGVALRFFWNGSYEKMSLKAWSQLAATVDFALDIGAHTGAYTLAALSANPAVTVLSFEPHFMNFARLNLNLRVNGFSTARSFMHAVGAKNEVLPFTISTGLDWLTSGGAIGTRDKGITTNVQVVSLDTFPHPDIKSKIGLIKIDTEGFEAECLEGMKGIIAAHRPTIFFECIDPAIGERVQSVLREYGYAYYEIDDNQETITPVTTVRPSLDERGKAIYGRFNRIAACGDAISRVLFK